MKTVLNYLALITSISIATVAAYFSVVGLSTMFVGAQLGVVIMASILEFGKLVTAAYLHIFWQQLNYLKYYLVTAVVVLMLITSLGIFGYLSRAHADQSLISGGYDLQLQVIQERKDAQQSKIDRLKQRVVTLDVVLNNSKPQDRNYVNRVQTNEREQIAKDIDLAVERVIGLNEELLPIKRKVLEQESEIGPIKYVAEIFYGTDDDEYLDNAIRWVIFSIIFVFDPLAVLLLITATGIFVQQQTPPPPPKKKTSKKYVLQVPKNSVADFSDTK
jgi:hypothetical protein